MNYFNENLQTYKSHWCCDCLVTIYCNESDCHRSANGFNSPNSSENMPRPCFYICNCWANIWPTWLAACRPCMINDNTTRASSLCAWRKLGGQPWTVHWLHNVLNKRRISGHSCRVPFTSTCVCSREGDSENAVLNIVEKQCVTGDKMGLSR